MPANVTLVPLPPYSPELNPVERVWLYLRERFLSHRVLDDYGAIARRRLPRPGTPSPPRPGRLASLTAYPFRSGMAMSAFQAWQQVSTIAA